MDSDLSIDGLGPLVLGAPTSQTMPLSSSLSCMSADERPSSSGRSPRLKSPGSRFEDPMLSWPDNSSPSGVVTDGPSSPRPSQGLVTSPSSNIIRSESLLFAGPSRQTSSLRNSPRQSSSSSHFASFLQFGKSSKGVHDGGGESGEIVEAMSDLVVRHHSHSAAASASATRTTVSSPLSLAIPFSPGSPAARNSFIGSLSMRSGRTGPSQTHPSLQSPTQAGSGGGADARVHVSGDEHLVIRRITSSSNSFKGPGSQGGTGSVPAAAAAAGTDLQSQTRLALLKLLGGNLSRRRSVDGRSSASGLPSAPLSSTQHGPTSPGPTAPQTNLTTRLTDTANLPVTNNVRAWPGPPSSPQKLPSRPFSSSTGGAGGEQTIRPGYGAGQHNRFAEGATSPDFRKRSVAFSKLIKTSSSEINPESDDDF